MTSLPAREGEQAPARYSQKPVAGMHGPFDLSWFVPAMLKYRRMFRDVLVASFFLQILALLTAGGGATHRSYLV